MEKFLITGGKKLEGKINVSGAKNVALKTIVAACLTEEKVIIHNIPLISDFMVMVDIIRHIGGNVTITDHTAIVQMADFSTHKISLEAAAEIRTSALLIAPMLARLKQAIIPNPGGCRIGARPIDRTIDGLKQMGVDVVYDSDDGYFHARTDGLQGTTYQFVKNSHTGTETLIMAAALAKGETVLENAAEEPEVDELIAFLNAMGAKIMRVEPRTIRITGVEKLHGTTVTIDPDRNEVVTLAVGAVMTKGDILIKDVKKDAIAEFLRVFEEAGGGYEEKEDGVRFFYKGPVKPIDVMTSPHPGFMTDWQGPWVVFMTMAEGTSVMHETVYENRFGYVKELVKMGASIELFNPEVKDPHEFYNFNYADNKQEYFHAARVHGPKQLHNAVVHITDLRAGATLVLAALCAKGESAVFGIEHLDRGYERFEERLRILGADVIRVSEE